MPASVDRRIQGEIRKILISCGLIKADAYSKIADELASLLIRTWDDETRAAIADVVRLLRGNTGVMDKKVWDEQLDALSTRLGPLFANRVAAPVFEAHVESFTKGMKDVKASFAASFRQIDNKAIAALHEHNIYWVKNQFDVNLREKTVEFGSRIIRDGLDFRQAGELFENEFAEQYQAYGTNYWRGFANNVVTRSREIGHVNAYERAGVEYLEIRAVLDHRTTPICREMHGRIIAVKKAIKMRDDLLNAATPEDVKQIAPWRDEDFVRGKKTSGLPTGMSLPPYHFRCRTRTISAKVDDDVQAEYGQAVKDKDKGLLESLTPAEHYARARGLSGAKWRKEDLAGDFDKHAGDFGIDDKRDYIDLSKKTISTADYILAAVFDGEMQYHFFSTETGGIVYVDMANQIRGCYGHDDAAALEKAFKGIRKGRLWLKQIGRN